MISGLSSFFAPYLKEMMSIKRNSGFDLNYMDSHIVDFDVFCKTTFPAKRQLDQELVETWVYNTKSNSRIELSKRILTMRHFANYLSSIDMEAYLCPIRIKIPKSPMPHIFTDEQLAEFFFACDSYKPTHIFPYRHILIPTMFRMIYCCGLRSSEACNLKRGDVDLNSGILKIIASKICKDRVVYLTPDMLKLCVKYDAAMEILIPMREYFFPRRDNKHFTSHAIAKCFNQLLKKTSFYNKTSKKPTCHGLRHVFAINSMRQCIANGDNFDSYIHYLSKYMGHKNPQETMYYLHMTASIASELREKAKGFDDVIGGQFYVEE